MKETFYFPHDYHARHDYKLDNLLNDKGLEAVGAYWCIVEMLYENNGLMPMKCERIANALRTDKSLIEYVIKDSELFLHDNDSFWSNSVNRRLDERRIKSLKATTSANKRWNKNANAMPTQCEGNAIKERKERKEICITSKLVKPTPQEVSDYAKQLNFTIDSNYFVDYYEARGWKFKTGQPVKDWKACVRTWKNRNGTANEQEQKRMLT